MVFIEWLNLDKDIACHEIPGYVWCSAGNMMRAGGSRFETRASCQLDEVNWPRLPPLFCELQRVNLVSAGFLTEASYLLLLWRFFLALCLPLHQPLVHVVTGSPWLWLQRPHHLFLLCFSLVHLVKFIRLQKTNGLGTYNRQQP